MLMMTMTTVTMMMMTASQTCNNWVDQCYVLGFSRNFSDAALQTALIIDSVVQSWKVMDRTVHKSTTSTQPALITVTSCTAMDCTVVWYRKPIVLLYPGTECIVPLHCGTESQLYQNCSVLENALYRGPVRGKVLDIPSFIISYKLILPYFLLFIISSLIVIIARGFLVNV